MSVKDLSMDELHQRHKSNLVKNPNDTIQNDADLHFEFKKVMYRFLQEFGQSSVTFKHKFSAGTYKITINKKEVSINLNKDGKINAFQYNFPLQLVRKNNKELDDKHVPKFIELTRKIIVDVLKNDVKYT